MSKHNSTLCVFVHALPCLQKYMSAFSASKYALYGLTEALRAELAQDNIHVGQVAHT
jgi:short-subunit dehydrogenase